MSFFTALLPAASRPASSGNFFSDNFLTIALVVVLVVMVLFMVRNSRKRKRDAEELQNKFVPGAEVMTQHGIFGTLVSVDDEKNEAIIETTPGTRLRVHRQTIARVIEPQDVAPEKDVVTGEPSEESAEGSAVEPQYGERLPAEHEPAVAGGGTTEPAKPAARATAARSASTTRSATTSRSTAGSGAGSASGTRSSTARAGSSGTGSTEPAKPRTTRQKPAGSGDSDE